MHHRHARRSQIGHSAHPRTAPARPWRSCDRANAAAVRRNDTNRFQPWDTHCHACRAPRHGHPLRSRPRARPGCGRTPPGVPGSTRPASVPPPAHKVARGPFGRLRKAEFGQYIAGRHQIGGRKTPRPDRPPRSCASGHNSCGHRAEYRIGLQQCDRHRATAMTARAPGHRCRVQRPHPAGLRARIAASPRPPGAKAAHAPPHGWPGNLGHQIGQCVHAVGFDAAAEVRPIAIGGRYPVPARCLQVLAGNAFQQQRQLRRLTGARVMVPVLDPWPGRCLDQVGLSKGSAHVRCPDVRRPGAHCRRCEDQ